MRRRRVRRGFRSPPIVRGGPGTVDGADFSILASNFGRSLPAPVAAAAVQAQPVVKQTQRKLRSAHAGARSGRRVVPSRERPLSRG